MFPSLPSTGVHGGAQRIGLGIALGPRRKFPQSGRLPCDRQRFGHRPGGQCLNYFTVWDRDHRIEVAPGQFQAPFADLFDNEVKTTA